MHLANVYNILSAFKVYILSVHDLGVASTMLYSLSYRNVNEKYN